MKQSWTRNNKEKVNLNTSQVHCYSNRSMCLSLLTYVVIVYSTTNLSFVQCCVCQNLVRTYLCIFYLVYTVQFSIFCTLLSIFCTPLSIFSKLLSIFCKLLSIDFYTVKVSFVHCLGHCVQKFSKIFINESIMLP